MGSCGRVYKVCSSLALESVPRYRAGKSEKLLKGAEIEKKTLGKEAGSQGCIPEPARLKGNSEGTGSGARRWGEEEPKRMPKTLLFVWDFCLDFCFPRKGLNSENGTAQGQNHVNPRERQKNWMRGN